MLIVPIKGFLSDIYGQLPKGVPCEVSEIDGKRFIRMGLANPGGYETKVVREVPAPRPFVGPDAGEALASSASQAGQASRPTTASESASGGKKRGRPRKESSQ